MKTLHAAVLAVMLGAASCSPLELRPLNRAALRASKPRTIFARVLPPADFSHQLRGLEYETESDYGPGPRRDKRLEDPAERIAASLADVLAKRFDLATAGVATSRTATQASAPGDADLLLELRTSRWGVISDSAVATAIVRGRYGVVYEATVELTDARANRSVASGRCGAEFDQRRGATAVELTSDDAALLKRLLHEAADRCAADLRRDVLSMP